MAKGYFTTKISDNLEETPEGFLIARGCTIARTGWQDYKVGDLPQEKAAGLGVDVSNPSATISLYRPPEEVFHPDTLASFEGKPVTDNHPEGGEFVEPENFNELARGHVQNVRKGKEPLESGDWPMVGDVHITAEPLLSKVRNKLVRELSCGYDYSIRRDGEKILQVDITGNHVAVVPKGRAGPEARINDAADSSTVATSTATQAVPTALPKKEKRPVKNHIKHLLGLGLKAMAADAEPEDLAEAAEAVSKHQEPPAESEDKKTNDAAKDSAKDAVATDEAARRKRMHDALDRALDSEPDEEDKDKDKVEDARAADADLEELKGVMDALFGEKEKEEEKGGEAEDEEEEEEFLEEESEAEDADDGPEGPGQCTEESGKESVVGDARAADRARAADGAETVLKVLRPFIARSNDAALHKAFNTALRSVNGVSRVKTEGGYGKFAAASRARDNKGRGRAADGHPQDQVSKMQEFYDNALKGGK